MAEVTKPLVLNAGTEEVCVFIHSNTAVNVFEKS